MSSIHPKMITYFEHEIVTVKALQRIQFFVPAVHQDAFMKVTDIATALTAITK